MYFNHLTLGEARCRLRGETRKSCTVWLDSQLPGEKQKITQTQEALGQVTRQREREGLWISTFIFAHFCSK